MKKNLKFPTILALLILNLAVAVFLAGNAFAAGSFFLEIGKPSSTEEITKNWEDLSKKYKKSLSTLKLYPKSIIDEQGQTSNVIQAGEIAEKNKAQAICNMLFAKNIPCFVIEGIEGKPPTMSIGMAQATKNPKSGFVLPWQDIAAAPQISASDDLASNEQEESEPESLTEADVDVAEAISVPLSNKTSSVSVAETKITPLTTPEKRKSLDNRRNAPLVEFSSSEAGRLNIGSFSSENEANEFWNTASDKYANLVDGLSVRIQKSLSAGGNSGIQVSVGQFANGGKAAEFCNKAVIGFSPALKCRYEEESDVFTDATSDHTNAYEQRRLLVKKRLPAKQRELYHVEEKSLEEDKKFWAQVAISDSKEEAQYRLKEIQKTNKKIIGDLSSAISYSASAAHGKYAAKLGSFASEDEAQKTCDKLQQRGVDCLVVSR